jgi:hypothetical protein
MNPQGIDQYCKDIMQIIVWCITIIGGILAAVKIIYELTNTRKVRGAELALKIFEKADENPGIKNAYTMLDWDGSTYEIEKGRKEVICFEDLADCLRVTKLKFNKKEKFVRDSFDELFELFEQLELYLKKKLILFEDVYVRTRYYVDKIIKRETHFSPFLDYYNYTYAKAFINRFREKSKKVG